MRGIVLVLFFPSEKQHPHWSLASTWMCTYVQVHPTHNPTLCQTWARGQLCRFHAKPVHSYFPNIYHQFIHWLLPENLPDGTEEAATLGWSFSLHQAGRTIKSRRWKPGSWQSVATEQLCIPEMSPPDGDWIEAGYFFNCAGCRSDCSLAGTGSITHMYNLEHPSTHFFMYSHSLVRSAHHPNQATHHASLPSWAQNCGYWTTT